jgi:GTP cyclohydrolase I
MRLAIRLAGDLVSTFATLFERTFLIMRESAQAPLRREYPGDFKSDDAYRASLPDSQNSGSEAIVGAAVKVNQAGCARFRLPLRYRQPSGEVLTLETRVTGTVSLPADRKGVNMSRIPRIFGEFIDKEMTPAELERILARYRNEIETEDASLLLRFAWPARLDSLRSGLSGYQYYDAAYESFTRNQLTRHRLHFDFLYSSACPASAALADHAEEERGIYSIPHSQRSLARLCVELAPGAELTFEDLRLACQRALFTEVQVMVRREDEQAFAEMNGAHPKFVEDAARLLYAELGPDSRIGDFRLMVQHFESLHAHDAVASIVKGVEGGFRPEVTDF